MNGLRQGRHKGTLVACAPRQREIGKIEEAQARSGSPKKKRVRRRGKDRHSYSRDILTGRRMYSALYRTEII